MDITRAAPSHFTTQAVELLFGQSGSSDSLTIDMSVVTSIDLPAIPLLLASIAARRRRGLPTKVNAPNEEKIFDYLEAWNFFSQAEVWTGQSRKDCFTKGTLQKLDAREASTHVNRYVTDRLPKYGFPIRKISVDQERPLYAAARERDLWLKGPIQNVISAAVGKQASRFVARAVIFEGIKNTAMHSGAELVFTTSQVQFAPKEHGAQEFAVCIWDNGASIAETLKEGLRTFSKITTPLYGRIVEHFTIEVFEKGVSTYSYNLTNEDGMPPEVDDELALIVSAFFFGVSADPTPRPDDELPDKDIGSHVSQLAGGADVYGGYGTYLITDTIAYQCGGEVEYFNGPYHLTITTTGEPDRYYVRAEVSDAGAPGVQGNLLVVRVPGDYSKQRSAPTVASEQP